MTHIDLTTKELVTLALERKEGVLASNGALRVETGARTGRSANDRFLVKEPSSEHNIDWGDVNKPISEEKFKNLWAKVEAYLDDRDHFISHLQVGADSEHYLPVTVVTELAWHSLFARQLFIRKHDEVNSAHPEWTILHAPNFKAVPEVDQTNSEAAIIINLAKRRVLICGTHYAGEIKKSMFSILNYQLPERGVLPMHCSANMGDAGDTAIFFGLSGTGKTTLSADPKRRLIGDDEHGWSKDSIFNFEGGCYAKCIDLSPEREPVIWQAIKHGATMENVVLDKDGVPDFSNSSLSQNTRAAYPREHIELRVDDNRGNTPDNVIFLSCDLYGVLPPIAKLTREQAAYYFLSGYTALMGSTEVGMGTAIKPTFSTCFGAPFFPRPAQVYAELLLQRLDETGASVYLVNTGWTGGAYGAGGERFSIPTSRAVVDAIINGDAAKAEYQTMERFNFAIPTALPGVASELLNPEQGWGDKAAFAHNCDELIQQFQQNFKQHSASSEIQGAGPV